MPVVDASVMVDLVAQDVGSAAPARMLFGRWGVAGTEPVGPSLLWLETSNARLTGVRGSRWSGADADAAYARLERIPLRRADTARDQARAFELARRYDNWPVCDMVYVALAERLGTELITADQRLRDRLAHLGRVKGIEEGRRPTRGPAGRGSAGRYGRVEAPVRGCGPGDDGRVGSVQTTTGGVPAR